jgi:Zinc-ribbon containing domain
MNHPDLSSTKLSEKVIWDSLMEENKHKEPTWADWLPVDWHYAGVEFIASMVGVANAPADEGEQWQVPHQTIFSGEMAAGGKIYCAGCAACRKLPTLTRLERCPHCESDVFFFHATKPQFHSRWLRKIAKYT